MSYSKPTFKDVYGNFINGKFIAPLGGQYFENTSPIDSSLIAKYPRSQKEDIDMALDAANAAKDAWGNTSVTERAAMLNKVADIIEQNLEEFALVETCDNGKPIRETLNADIPLSVDHWRYFAACIRAEEGSATELDAHTLSMNIKEPLGVVGQIIPWNFPMLMLSWKFTASIGNRKLCGFKTSRANAIISNLINGENCSRFSSWSHQCSSWFWTRGWEAFSV